MSDGISRPSSDCVLAMQRIFNESLEDSLDPVRDDLQRISAELTQLAACSIKASGSTEHLTELVKRHDKLLLGESGGNGLNGDMRNVKQSMAWAKAGLIAVWAILVGSGAYIFKTIHTILASQSGN